MSWLSELFNPKSAPPPPAYTPPAASDGTAAMRMQLDYLEKLRQDQLTKDAAFQSQDPTATRNAALGTVGGAFAPEFQSSWLPSNATDALEGEFYSKQRASADDYLNNLLKRGVITQTGFNAGTGELDRQSAGVRTKLDSLGQMLLNQERDTLGGYADRARGAASSLPVGGTFDITPFTTGAQGELSSFQSKLGDLYGSQVPSDLFDKTVLASIAGGAQGAGNRPFDPAAVAGGVGGSPDDDPFAPKKTTPARSSTVF